ARRGRPGRPSSTRIVHTPAVPSAGASRTVTGRALAADWPHLGGDGALRPTAVLLSVTASVRRHRPDPWVYLKHVVTELPARPPGPGLSDLLPDLWGRPQTGPMAVPG